MKEHENEHKDNTGMIIAIVVIVLLLLGVIAYFAMNGKDEVENAIDETGDTIEQITDNDRKTAADVAGSYQAEYQENTDEAETDADINTKYLEVVLDKDGNATISFDNDNTVKGTFNVTASRITVISTASDEEETEAEEDAATNNLDQTYEFTINDDDTLSYQDGSRELTLTKVNKNTLKFIK